MLICIVHIVDSFLRGALAVSREKKKIYSIYIYIYDIFDSDTVKSINCTAQVIVGTVMWCARDLAVCVFNKSFGFFDAWGPLRWGPGGHGPPSF